MMPRTTKKPTTQTPRAARHAMNLSRVIPENRLAGLDYGRRPQAHAAFGTQR